MPKTFRVETDPRLVPILDRARKHATDESRSRYIMSAAIVRAIQDLGSLPLREQDAVAEVLGAAVLGEMLDGNLARRVREELQRAVDIVEEVREWLGEPAGGEDDV